MWFIFVLGAICLGSLAIGAYSLAPWLPCFERDLPRVFALANLKAGEQFYDLGSGDGRLVRYAAKKYGAKATGIEIGFPLYVWSVLIQLFQRLPAVTYRLSNFFIISLKDADVVYIFGRPGKLGKKITEKLCQELRPGSRVISYTFPLEGKTPFRTDKPRNQDLSLYLYLF
jgi:hypothetical protein